MSALNKSLSSAMLLLALSFVNSAVAQDDGKYILYTVNGVRTEPLRAAMMLNVTKAIVGDKYDGRDIQPFMAPNTTEPLAADFFETIDQWLNQVDLANFGWGQIVAFSLAEVFRDLNFGSAVTRNQATVDQHAELYKEHIKAGDSVLVVAHSQGNFYVNDAIAKVEEDLAGQTESAKRITAFHVATPTNKWADDDVITSTEAYLTNERDIISNVPQSLDPNLSIEQLSDNQELERVWNSQWWVDQYPVLNILGPFRPAALSPLVDTMARVSAHDYVNVYANDELNTYGALQQGIFSALERLEFPEEINDIAGSCELQMFDVNFDVVIDPSTLDTSAGGLAVNLIFQPDVELRTLDYDPLPWPPGATPTGIGSVVDQFNDDMDRVVDFATGQPYHSSLSSGLSGGPTLFLCSDGVDLSSSQAAISVPLTEFTDDTSSALVTKVFSHESLMKFDKETSLGFIHVVDTATTSYDYHSGVGVTATNRNNIESYEQVRLEFMVNQSQDVLTVNSIGHCKAEQGTREYNDGNARNPLTPFDVPYSFILDAVNVELESVNVQGSGPFDSESTSRSQTCL